MVRKTERDYLKFDWKCRRQGIFWFIWFFIL